LGKFRPKKIVGQISAEKKIRSNFGRKKFSVKFWPKTFVGQILAENKFWSNFGRKKMSVKFRPQKNVWSNFTPPTGPSVPQAQPEGHSTTTTWRGHWVE
jgi:hypothetical protein